jgi:hypothetical protein
VLGVQGDDRRPPAGTQPRGQDPRQAQGARRNMNPPPSDNYDFNAPGAIRPPRGGPTVRRPGPDQNFAPGQQPNFRERPDPRRSSPPPRFDRGPPRQERFNGPPPNSRGGSRSGSSFNGRSFGGGGMDRGPRMPRGEPRNPRSFR